MNVLRTLQEELMNPTSSSITHIMVFKHDNIICDCFDSPALFLFVEDKISCVKQVWNEMEKALFISPVVVPAILFAKTHHMHSNSSIRCLVLPDRICRKVLYLSRPARTFSAWMMSFCVRFVSSRALASSELRAWRTGDNTKCYKCCRYGFIFTILFLFFGYYSW